MRRLVAQIGVVAMLLSLTACGDDEPNADGPTTPAASSILIWADEASAPVLEEVAAAHEAATNVEVNVQAIDSSEIRTLMPEQATQGLGPDLLIGRSDWVGQFVDSHLLAPIDLGDQTSRFRPVSTQAMRYSGQDYGVPFATESLALLRNTDLAPDAPASIEAMASDGLRLQDDGKVSLPIALPVGDFGDAYHWNPFYSASGGVLFGTNAEGEYLPDQIGVGEPGSISAAEDLAKLTEDKVLDPDVTADQALDAFLDGEAAYFISGPWSVQPAQEADIPLAVSPVPGFSARPASAPQALVISAAFMLSAFAANPEGAEQFLTHTVMTTDVMSRLAAASDHLVPAWQESYQAVSGDPIIKGFADFADASAPYPSLPEFDEVLPALSQAQLEVMNGEDPKETMVAAGEEIHDALTSK